MDNHKILILGATGLLGVPLSKYLIEQGYTVIRQGFQKNADYNVDLRRPKDTQYLLDKVKPDVIINLVALTDVDRCEDDINLAYMMNVLPVENLLPWLKCHANTRLIHLSTDHIYDGTGPHPEERIAIRNIYALTKYCAELVALRSNACVLRTNFFGKSLVLGKPSFSDWLVDSLTQGKQIKLFTDIFFSPLSINTLLKMISVVINSFNPGVYNVGCLNGMSKRNFGHILANQLSLNLSNAKNALSTDVCLKARRPLDMRMDSTLFEKTFHVTLPYLTDEIISLRSEYAR